MKTAGTCFLLVLGAITALAQQQKPVPKETLRVRPLAEVRTLLHGSSLSHEWASFYVASEEADGSVKPIQIAYAFYHSNQLPPESFWDYSKTYEIGVQREHGCDVNVESMAYVRNVTEGGRELPVIRSPLRKRCARWPTEDGRCAAMLRALVRQLPRTRSQKQVAGDKS